MNGVGPKGGAYGFRVSSINKLVDTKSVNNTTLLHFLERTVSVHFSEMEGFLKELAKPADAYRVNLQDTKKATYELKEGLRTLRTELQDHFADMDNASQKGDLFGKKMWRFVGEAKERLDDLADEVTLADTTFSEVVKYYGEDEKSMGSTEFFGIFKTFVTSYLVRSAFQLRYLSSTILLEMQNGKPNVCGGEGSSGTKTATSGRSESSSSKGGKWDHRRRYGHARHSSREATRWR